MPDSKTSEDNVLDIPAECVELHQQASALLAAIIESSDDAIVSKSLKGIISSWNAGAERIFGYTAAEAVGRPITMIIPTELLGEEEMVLGLLRQGQRIEHFETTRVTKDGRRLPISLTVSPVRNSNGTIIGASKIARDITEQKQIEARLKDLAATLEEKVVERTAVAERRARQLQSMALQLTHAEEQERQKLAHMLHDGLQQLLVAAKFSLGVIRKRSESLPDVADAVGQLDQILQESIEASRSLAYELSPPALYENGLTAALHWLSRQMIEKHGLSVNMEIAEIPFEIPIRLRVVLFQAVREFLLNIVKHAQVDRAELRLNCEGDDLILTVSDRGVGFNQNGDNNATADGFGLFGIRERINLLGGTMSIASTPNLGSCFTLKVNPGHADKPPEPRDSFAIEDALLQNLAPKTAHTLGDSGMKRILLVDDHQVIRRGLALLLNEAADMHVVGEAANGLEAIQLVRNLNPDVVLMDISMPVMDGIEATQRIHSEFPHVMVIGLSMHEEPPLVQRMYSVGARAYFNKGNSSDQLFDTIRQFTH